MFQDNHSSHLQGTAGPLNMGLTGFPEMSVTTSLHCLSYQDSEDLMYTVAEARNLANFNGLIHFNIFTVFPDVVLMLKALQPY